MLRNVFGSEKVTQMSPKGFIALLTFVVTSLFSPSCIADGLEIADGFFYNQQYEKAITEYQKILEDAAYEQSVKYKVQYKVGLSYFLNGDVQKAALYWREAKLLNPGLLDGKIFRNPSNSMVPTLLPGDLLLVDNDYYRHKPITRGDVVVFLGPNKRDLYIQRILGMPGDLFQIKDKEVFVNGLKVFDKFADFSGAQAPIPNKHNYGPLKIPEGRYFLLGDNRNDSLDSRVFGPVDQNLIVAKAIVIYGNAPSKYSMEGASLERAGIVIK
jgi:signal peptidase I